MTMPDWIAADWGTSNMRVWGMTSSGDVLFAEKSNRGMAQLSSSEYVSVLAEVLGDRVSGDGSQMPLVVCGMAGARTGWREAGYLDLPTGFDQLGSGAIRFRSEDDRFEVSILPGVRRSDATGEDVMRGEETQLAGLCANRPGFTGLVCLPGTHSKWAQIENGQLTWFASAMTGELFEALSTHTVLKHALTGETSGPRLEDGVRAGMADGIAHPERLSSLVFRTRAAALVADRSSDWCSGYLSGVLVGAEVAGYRTLRGDAPVVLIGSDRLCRLYASAISRDGGSSEIYDAAEATLDGLKAARHHAEKSAGETAI